jgi:hypothetical protein
MHVHLFDYIYLRTQDIVFVQIAARLHLDDLRLR